MKREVSLRCAAVFTGAVVPMALLVLSLRGDSAVASGPVHSKEASWHKSTISCPIDRSRFGAAIGKRAHENPLLHDLMSSAISIAGRI
jgi:hypothetical protein